MDCVGGMLLTFKEKSTVASLALGITLQEYVKEISSHRVITLNLDQQFNLFLIKKLTII